MYPANITREEARSRSALLRTQAYDVQVDLSGRYPGYPEQNFVSTSAIDFTSGAGQTHLDVIADQVLSADLDGAALPLDDFDGERLPLQLAEGRHRLTVTALCRFSNTGEGLHRFVDPADDRVYLYTQLEVADARRVYPCFDQPDLKASFRFTVIGPQHWSVLSNSPEVTPVTVGDGVARWEFAPTPPISTYITAVIAGEYHTLHDHYRGKAADIPLSVSCRHSLAEAVDAERIFTVTKRGFDVFERHFGEPYPFADYAQVFVPEFNAGAMENAGCVTLRDEYLFRSRVTAASYAARDNTILHELAHMWFGDLVTMAWWDDLWLNESFAEWASHFAQADMRDLSGAGDPWATFCNQRKVWAYRQDQLPSTHPVAADMVDLEAVDHNFDGITYAKGAAVLHQLVAYVGLEQFLAALRCYFARHAFGNTELRDLLTALEESSGRDLSRFSAEWLQTAGVNTLRSRYELDDEGRFRWFAVEQSAPPEWPTLRRHRVGIGLFNWQGDRLARSDRFEIDLDGPLTEIPQLTGVRAPAFVLVNDGDLAYAKIRIDLGIDAVIEGLGGLDDQLARALCWAATWDMCRDAELTATDHVSMVLRGVSTESDLTAVAQLLSHAHTAVTYYCPPDERPALRCRLAQGLTELLQQAEPGSDHQLAFARALAEAACSSDHADWLAGWLVGSDVPDGLVVDDDLRWRLVTNLARLGAISEAQIAAEAERDRTATGAERAAGARAALPTHQAKQAAWELATLDPSLPNETHFRICSSFWQNDQEEVLTPYLDRYLEVVQALSEQRDGWGQQSLAIRKHVTDLLFPRTLADRAFLDRLDRWMAQTPLQDSVVRVLSERRDDAERALRCQEAARA